MKSVIVLVGIAVSLQIVAVLVVAWRVAAAVSFVV